MDKNHIPQSKHRDFIVRNAQLWSIIVIFVLITLHYYDDLSAFTLFSLSDLPLGLTRHTVDRILYLVPIILSSFVFGLRGGATALVITFLVMMPRAIFISATPITAILETFAVILIGSIAPIWSDYYKKQETQLEVTMERLESTQRKLHSKVRLSREQQKQLAVINAFSTILSQSLEVDKAMKATLHMVMEVMQVEVAIIFFLDEDAQELRVIGFEGIQNKTAMALDKTKQGAGVCGHVAATGQPLLIENIADNPDWYNPVLIEEGLKTQLSVPLISRGHIIGTLCTATRAYREFKEPEIELISALGNLVGIAIDNSHLFRERELAVGQLKLSEKKYRQLFENAHDAIWLQDTSGKIIAANYTAGELFGYAAADLIGTDIRQFLPLESLFVLEEVQTNLLGGHTHKQPYRQKLIKKDGSEAILMLTTNLISSNGHPGGLQFIARDITNEVRMQENQSFYLQQITKAHEEERLRISRDLHDSTAQSLIAALHRLEDFCKADKYLPMASLRSLWSLHEQLKDSLQEIRQLSRDLRPSILDDLGLLPAVEWLTEQLSNEHKIAANLTISGEEKRFAPEIEVAIFRIVQEALRNIARHAQATEVQVNIDLKDSETKVTITDDGKGFKVPTSLGEFSRLGKLGIDGMQTRARLLNGTFDIQSGPGKGTVLTVTVPV